MPARLSHAQVRGNGGQCVWFGKRMPLPMGVPRGQCHRLTRAVWQRVEAGLRGLT